MSRFTEMLQSISLPSPQEMAEDIKEWIQTRGPWWATSVTAHAVIISTVLLLMGTVAKVIEENEPPAIDAAKVDTEIKEQELDHFDIGDTPLDPTELNTDTLTQLDAPQMAQTEQINTTPDDPFSEAGGGGQLNAANDFGGLGGFEVRATGPGAKVTGAGGVGSGKGDGNSAGSGGGNAGFGGRGTGVRKAMLGKYGGTKGSERAVAGALMWLSKHQNSDGSWSLDAYQKRCKDASCTGKASATSDCAATALALLPFLAAGQTHQSKGPYKANISAGLYWLLKQQKSDGNLSGTSGVIMYTHGLATICLCEAYGLSNDKNIGNAAQNAIHYIEKAQDPAGGGWRYNPGDAGDTSVVGWQVMALKSAQMAGLSVSTQVLENAKKFLKSASQSQGGLFAYQPGGAATPPMSSVGLLCTQYLGAPKNDPAILEGQKYLMNNLPDANNKQIYYWYYATQVMHNIPGYEWDTWNRKMRKILIDSQIRQGCALGSWDPAGHTWGEAGGRLMVTALSCLTLEVYYRYLPLYKLDK